LQRERRLKRSDQRSLDSRKLRVERSDWRRPIALAMPRQPATGAAHPRVGAPSYERLAAFSAHDHTTTHIVLLGNPCMQLSGSRFQKQYPRALVAD
jgi:hypothetical protein